VTITSLGGPLALAALYAPVIVAGASASAGLATLAAAVVFGAPLLIWHRWRCGPGSRSSEHGDAQLVDSCEREVDL
jgi:hypothetical protein